MAASTDTTGTKPYTIDDHPKARRSIEMTRSWAAIITLGIVTLVSTQAGVPTFDAVLRGLVAGIAMYVIAWAVTVTVWREIVRTELSRAREARRERYAAAQQALLEAQQEAARQAAELEATE